MGIDIDKVKQITTITCETCEKSFDTNTPALASEKGLIPWRLAVEKMRDKNWKMKLGFEGLHWVTYCNNCK